MDDLISRQAAIDAAKHAWAKGLEPSQYIEIIPPAQPEAKEDWLYDYLVGRLGKSIVDNKEEFHKWFERMVWHVKRCDELSEERRSRQWISCEEIQPEERTKSHAETHACDLISSQAAVELAMKYCPDDDGTVQCDGDIRGLLDELENLPPAQPEHDAEFWRKRAEEYSNICLAMTAEMTKGIKFNSIRIDENGICFGKEQPEQKWIPCSERLPENRVSVIVCFREWQQYAKRYVYSIVVGWYARKHSVHENVFSDWEADCEYDEIEDEYYIEEGWYEFTTQGNGDLMNWYINADVIAWMPLPEPWKEGETNGLHN